MVAEKRRILVLDKLILAAKRCSLDAQGLWAGVALAELRLCSRTGCHRVLVETPEVFKSCSVAMLSSGSLCREKSQR